MRPRNANTIATHEPAAGRALAAGGTGRAANGPQASQSQSQHPRQPQQQAQQQQAQQQAKARQEAQQAEAPPQAAAASKKRALTESCPTPRELRRILMNILPIPAKVRRRAAFMPPSALFFIDSIIARFSSLYEHPADTGQDAAPLKTAVLLRPCPLGCMIYR